MASSHQTTLWSRQLLRNLLVSRSSTSRYTCKSKCSHTYVYQFHVKLTLTNIFMYWEISLGMIDGFEKSKVQTFMLNHRTMTPQKKSWLHLELPKVFPSTLNPKCWKSNIDMMAVIDKMKANICQQRWWWWWVIQADPENWPSSLLGKTDFSVITTEAMMRVISLDHPDHRLRNWKHGFFWFCNPTSWHLTTESQSFTKEHHHHHYPDMYDKMIVKKIRGHFDKWLDLVCLWCLVVCTLYLEVCISYLCISMTRMIVKKITMGHFDKWWLDLVNPKPGLRPAILWSS